MLASNLSTYHSGVGVDGGLVLHGHGGRAGHQWWRWHLPEFGALTLLFIYNDCHNASRARRVGWKLGQMASALKR